MALLSPLLLRKRTPSASTSVFALAGRFSGCAALLVLLVSLAGCGQDAQDRPPLVLRSVRPLDTGERLRLNDDIILEFSDDLDATSVTRDSVTLVDPATGAVAKGRWVTTGSSLRFVPEAALTPSLRDGGFRPGVTYELRLAGFPILGGLRSTHGAGLERSLSLEVPIVGLEGDDAGDVFRDTSPGNTRILRLLAEFQGKADNPLPWNEPLLVACNGPLDPRSLRASDFEIVRRSNAARPLSPVANQEPPIRIKSIRLQQNIDEDVSATGSGARAILRFVPRSPLLGPNERFTTAFELRLKPSVQGPSMADYSGKSPYFRSLTFFAARSDGVSAESDQSYVFEFDDDSDFAPVLDPNSDGTARWAGTGRIEIRYPAAAGSGRDGQRTLKGQVESTDLHATRIEVPLGETAELPAEGLVVLRAQGRFDVTGKITRRAKETPNEMWSPVRRTAVAQLASLEYLTPWLKAAQERGESWTVIVAGGDLVVRGEIDVDTPLLLVAGGRIRGSGRPKTMPGQLWLLGDGGGFDAPIRLDPGAMPMVDPPLLIDEPIINPLVRPLTFVAISSPAPKASAPRNWGRPQVVASREAPEGAARVQFIPADALRNGEEGLGQAVRAVEPMGALDPDSSGARVRLRIELTVRPTRGRWNPPFLDRVRLVWTPE